MPRAQSPPDRPDDFIGRVVGSYELTSILGHGGMGSVFAGERLNATSERDRHVAVKILAPRLASNRKARRRFIREARFQARMRHPNIVPVLDAGRGLGTSWIAMPRYEGGSLAKLLVKRGMRVSFHDAMEIWIALFDALGHAHDLGFIHRDIKPANVLLDSHNQPALADFGLVGVMQGTRRELPDLPDDVAKLGTDTAALARLTSTGNLMGTPAYMAPEQILARTVDHRADLYAMGGLMFSSVCGRPLYDGSHELMVLQQHLFGTPTDPRSFAPDLPDPVAEVMLRLLARDPNERFQSARDVITALDPAGLKKTQKSILRPPVHPDTRLANPPRPMRGSGWWKLIAVLLLVVAVAVAVAVIQGVQN